MRLRAMRRRRSVAPSQASVLLVMDQTVGEVPESMAGALVAATWSAVGVGTLGEHDGPTSITLKDEVDPTRRTQGLQKVFGGDLETPGGSIAVCTSEGEVLLESTVDSICTSVQAVGERPFRTRLHHDQAAGVTVSTRGFTGAIEAMGLSLLESDTSGGV